MRLAPLLRSADWQFRSRLSALSIVQGEESDYCGFTQSYIRYRIEQHVGSPWWKDCKETYWAVARLYQRWKRYCHYVREVKPEWRDTRQIHYMDNSLVQEQVDKDGNYREVELVGPGGDACF